MIRGGANAFMAVVRPLRTKPARPVSSPVLKPVWSSVSLLLSLCCPRLFFSFFFLYQCTVLARSINHVQICRIVFHYFSVEINVNLIVAFTKAFCVFCFVVVVVSIVYQKVLIRNHVCVLIPFLNIGSQLCIRLMLNFI